jgi:hypothetical protein
MRFLEHACHAELHRQTARAANAGGGRIGGRKRKNAKTPVISISLRPKADMCGATAHVPLRPIADIGPTSDEHSSARQDNSDLGELARLRIDFD